MTKQTVKPKVVSEKEKEPARAADVPRSDPVDIPKPEPKKRASRAKKVQQRKRPLKR